MNSHSTIPPHYTESDALYTGLCAGIPSKLRIAHPSRDDCIIFNGWIIRNIWPEISGLRGDEY